MQHDVRCTIQTVAVLMGFSITLILWRNALEKFRIENEIKNKL